MRYDRPVFFQTVVQGVYNPTTGDYAEDYTTETKRYGSVSDTGTETMNLVYGRF